MDRDDFSSIGAHIFHRHPVGKGMDDADVLAAKTDSKARERLVRHYQSLVHSIASDRRHTHHADFEDLVQAGYEGLLTAVNRFTEGRDFDKFAARCIRHAVCASYGRSWSGWEPKNNASLEQLMDEGFDVADELPGYLKDERQHEAIHKVASVAYRILNKREIAVIEAEMRAEPQSTTATRLGINQSTVARIRQAAERKIKKALAA